MVGTRYPGTKDVGKKISEGGEGNEKKGGEAPKIAKKTEK